MIFPYQGSQILITDSMCDSNGHLNMVQHCQVLEDGCYGFQEDLGYTIEYFNQGYSNFVLEMNIRYLHEVFAGDKVSTCYRLVDCGPKLFHYCAAILSPKDEICSVAEYVLAHVNLTERKTTNMNHELKQKMQNMLEEHKKSDSLNFKLNLSIEKKDHEQ